MIVVTGALYVDADAREGYLEGCRSVVEQARVTAGCLDFALSADLLDPRRINVQERWTDEASLATFRGSGPSSEQQQAIREADVQELRVEG